MFNLILKNTLVKYLQLIISSIIDYFEIISRKQQLTWFSISVHFNLFYYPLNNIQIIKYLFCQIDFFNLNYVKYRHYFKSNH